MFRWQSNNELNKKKRLKRLSYQSISKFIAKMKRTHLFEHNLLLQIIRKSGLSLKCKTECYLIAKIRPKSLHQKRSLSTFSSQSEITQRVLVQWLQNYFNTFVKQEKFYFVFTISCKIWLSSEWVKLYIILKPF